MNERRRKRTPERQRKRNDPREAKTLSHDTVASNPGALNVSRLRWIIHYPKWPLGLLMTFAAFAAATWFISWWFIIGALLLLFMNWFYWSRVREHFLFGCINPGVIVQTHPSLYAVSTDLSKGSGDYPVIKIIRKNISKVRGEPTDVGTRFATVAVYEGSPDKSIPHWIDFDPKPVDLITDNIGEIERVLDSIPASEWKDLDENLKKVPQPYEVGLYFIEANNAD